MNHLSRKTAYLILALVFAFFIYAAGVFTGVSYEGHLNQWSKNIDLSDYISMSLIALLSIGLLLSLKRSH